MSPLPPLFNKCLSTVGASANCIWPESGCSGCCFRVENFLPCSSTNWLTSWPFAWAEEEGGASCVVSMNSPTGMCAVTCSGTFSTGAVPWSFWCRKNGRALRSGACCAASSHATSGRGSVSLPMTPVAARWRRCPQFPCPNLFKRGCALERSHETQTSNPTVMNQVESYERYTFIRTQPGSVCVM